MDLTMFTPASPGTLLRIAGTDPTLGDWSHQAFVAEPLAPTMPDLSPATFMAVANARAALAALDSTARQLPNPGLLRTPTLRREAQSTSALEGTYAPLTDVLTTDEEAPPTPELREVLNYVRMANRGFALVRQGRSLTPGLLAELQGVLLVGTHLEGVSGRVRDTQVVIGRRADADPFGFPIHAARFVPAPHGIALETGLADLLQWMRDDHAGAIDPVVAAAMSHYQFETLHPFRDGNGRLGRFLVVLHLQATGVLSEPTLTVSPWFEARRETYYDRLLGVSTRGEWDGFIRFFAQGLDAAATQTRAQMISLVAVQADLKEQVRNAGLLADRAHLLVDFAVANPSFTVRRVEAELDVTYSRANRLVRQLVDIGVLRAVNPRAYNRRFFAPAVLAVLTDGALAA